MNEPQTNPSDPAQSHPKDVSVRLAFLLPVVGFIVMVVASHSGRENYFGWSPVTSGWYMWAVFGLGGVVFACDSLRCHGITVASFFALLLCSVPFLLLLWSIAAIG